MAPSACHRCCITSHISKDQHEVKLLHQGKTRKNERGQIWVLLVLSLIVLVVFVGLSIDFGMAYITKTTLSKAVDAAALVGMQNVNLGTGGSLPNCSLTTGAGAAALEAFTVNYKSALRVGTTPTPSICFSLDSNNNTIVNVSATTSLDTYFIRLLGSTYNTLSVSASSQAQRNPMIMNLNLDVSYSMNNNGGKTALGPAVKDFIADFDPNDNDMTDWVSVVTFGTFANVNLDNTQPLQTPVDNAVDGITWSSASNPNYTNSIQGLTYAQQRLLAKTLTPNTIRVEIFFTDGWPNIQQDTLQCRPNAHPLPSPIPVLYCGCDPGDESLGLCNNNSLAWFNPSGCSSNNTCNTVTGCAATTFPDHQAGGTSESLANVTYCGGQTPLAGQALASDAMYRAVKVAQSMRMQANSNNNIYVYAIGMGDAITKQPVAEEFLREVANDPNASTYNPALPIGEAVFASDSSGLTQVFQTIASKILLRLSK